ncbi:17.3 kDa class II heat shock protein-like [Actinidia eriantha]|uniref:17.3 kDa class II heat shock protein-like n=1 Tax=Actinidia eriantha TaxID=165200 RepID=UPI002589BD6E|nr:17.3 kDa class II heat shock protein-like [Actinidia eriantha]
MEPPRIFQLTLRSSFPILSRNFTSRPLSSIYFDLLPLLVKIGKFPEDRRTRASNFDIDLIKHLKIKMDLRLMGIDSPIFHALHHVLDAAADDKSSANVPSGVYVRDAKAMAATPADVKEYPNSYAFIVDMPGLKSGDIKVQVEEDRVLLISGERKREEEKEAGAKYVRMERRIGKLMRKFVLPENADTEAVSAVCQDGVLTVTVPKLAPPEPKKPKTIEVKIA